jgi:hypothetical protein
MPINLPTRLAQWGAVLRRVRDTYRSCHGRSPHLVRPRRYSEKMQWRKLFDLDPRYAIFSDKLASRGFIADRVGTDHLVPLLWYGDDPAEIPFGDLTPPYVLKSTHGCGHTIIVATGQEPDRDAIRATARHWLATCYGTGLDEPGYINVPRRLIVERQVFAQDGTYPLERKMLVFDGSVRVINTRFVDPRRTSHGAFHTAAWERLPWILTRPMPNRPMPRPPLLDDMAAIACRLAAGFEHLRVDIYDCGDRFYIGEITVYCWSGLSTFVPDEADFQLGAFWRLRRPLTRATSTMLMQPWAIKAPAAPSPP